MLWQEITSVECAAVARSIPVVIPIAAVEQHGPHLPLATDSMLLGEIVRRAEEALSDRALILPLLWLGNSHHHRDFAGTVSAEPRTYLDLIFGLASEVVAQGFQRVLLLNGHGGNIVPACQAMFELRQQLRHRDDLLLLSATYWQLGAASPEGMSQDHMGHACEWETSMMLRLAPKLVKAHRSLHPVAQAPGFTPAQRAWVTRERSLAGYLGDPASATAEKGERLLAGFATDVVRLVERMIAWDGRAWDA